MSVLQMVLQSELQWAWRLVMQMVLPTELPWDVLSALQ
jgi:hypothetical protein